MWHVGRGVPWTACTVTTSQPLVPLMYHGKQLLLGMFSAGFDECVTHEYCACMQQVKQFRVRRATPLREFREQLAAELGVPLDKQRLWTFAKRQNNTLRCAGLLRMHARMPNSGACSLWQGRVLLFTAPGVLQGSAGCM